MILRVQLALPPGNIRQIWDSLRRRIAHLMRASVEHEPARVVARIAEAEVFLEAGAFTKAMELLAPLAASGTPAAQRLLGLMYLNGQGALPNSGEALRWLQTAAESGDPVAQHQLALVLALGPHGAGSKTAFGKWYAAILESGAVLSSINVKDLFPDGTSFVRDPAGALAWARKAAEAGHIDAQTNLGILLLRGKDVTHDPAEARNCFEKAAAAGNPTAKAYLAILIAAEVEPDWAKAYGLLEAAAHADDVFAQITLGRWHLHGIGNRAQEPQRGAGLIALAAAKGVAEAQYLMGICAAVGLGLPQSYAQAETWWRRATIRNYAPAMLALGKLLGSGVTGVRNHIEAAPLFKRAAEAGLYEGQLIYGRYALVGMGTPQSFEEARGWFEKAFAQRDTPDVRFELERIATLAVSRSEHLNQSKFSSTNDID